MSTTLDDQAIAASAAPYIEAVRARIGGLSRERRTELLDDLAHHLAELAAEPDTDLSEQLGAPEDFAEEYLSSAGVELSPRSSAAAARDVVRDRVDVLASHRWTVALLDFLPELRPAWWVVRGYVPVAAALAGYGWTPLPFAKSGGEGVPSRLLGTALALAATLVSVSLGREAVAGRRVRLDRWVTIVGVLAVFLAIRSLTDVAGAGTVSYDDEAYSVADHPASGSVVSAEGNTITNLFVYDAQGNPLQNVYVVDQDGRPVSTPAVENPEKATRLPLNPDGSAITNRYPQEELWASCGPTGLPQYIPVTPPPFGFPTTIPTTATSAPAPPPTTQAEGGSSVDPSAPSSTLIEPNMGLAC